MPLDRKEVALKETWDLTPFFKDHESWEAAYEEVEELIATLSIFTDNINSAKSLLHFKETLETTNRQYNLLYIYAMLKADMDTRSTEAQGLVERVDYLGTKFGSTVSFFTPYILSLKEETLREYIASEVGLTRFEDDLFDTYRYKDHVLSKEVEGIVSRLGDSFSTPSNTYEMLNNADIVFGDVTAPDGSTKPLTMSEYAKLIEHEDRDVRREAYMAYYKPYVQLQNTIASTLAGAVKHNATMSAIREYPSALEKSLFHDNVPKAVFENLIDSTRKNLGILRSYNLHRKEKMGVKDLQPYDLSVPLVKGIKKDIPYDEAYEVMLEGLAPLGDEYIHLLREFKEKRMIDVRETKGKRTGAYNIGVYGIHPYVLLNHHDDLDSLFTLAHELGHAAHSHYSNTHQTYNQSSYSIFVAEVASTVNEVLLIRHLIANAENQEEKAYLLNHFIDQFKGTFFTQVMFAEFEKKTHERAEAGLPLNAEEFSAIYEELFREYNGNTLVVTEQMKYGWARIPHFYRPFYVYKYATGFASAVSIADSLIKQEEGALERYLEFLKSGSSEYPLDLLKKTGVDLESPETINSALALFNDLAEEFKALN